MIVKIFVNPVCKKIQYLKWLIKILEILEMICSGLYLVIFPRILEMLDERDRWVKKGTF